MPEPGTWQPGDILTADDLNAIGVWEDYTPTLTQSTSRSITVNYAKYVLINKMCFVNVDLTCTTTGSAGSAVKISYPFPPDTGGFVFGNGSGTFYDSSATDVYLLNVEAFQDAIYFRSETSTNSNFGATPSLAVGDNDVLSFSVVYKVA
jgi:hypothetical protein